MKVGLIFSNTVLLREQVGDMRKSDVPGVEALLEPGLCSLIAIDSFT